METAVSQPAPIVCGSQSEVDHLLLKTPATMRSSERGTTHLELVFILGIIGVVSAMVIPTLTNALDRNKVYTGSELVAAAIRNARLAAITRNATYRIRFDCPSAGSVRVLVVTGDPTIDNATNRCSTTVAEDGPAMFLPEGVSYGTVPTIEVNGRGQMSIPSAILPMMITVSYDNFTRALSVSPTGRVTTPSS
jgi:type IV fimbrial biogenesis protein FimU